MEDVLALYEKPLSEREPVVCVDEKPVVLHADVRPPRPMRRGRIAGRDSEYERCGTANVFCGVQPKAGRHFTKATANRSSPQFADYLVEIVASYPEADTIHLLMDNLSSHTLKGSRHWWAGSARRSEACCGIVSRCTTLQHTAVGSTRRRSRSACYPPSAWAEDESRRSQNCSRKRWHGTAI